MNGLTESFYPWSTPLFIAELVQHESLQKALLQHIYELSSRQQNAVESDVALSAKHNLFESHLDFLDQSKWAASVVQLKKALIEVLSMVIADVNHGNWPDNAKVKTEITESWYHLTKKGGYHDVHSHPNCSWCGIYCLKTPEVRWEDKSGINRFYDPRVNADQYKDAGSLYNGDEGVWDIALQEGQVVIFPSYIKHSALPYHGDEDRVVVAFNSQTQFLVED